MKQMTGKEKVPLLGSFIEENQRINEVCCKERLLHRFKSVTEKVKFPWEETVDFSRKAWEMGKSDPRKIVFAAKMGLALSIVSLCLFWRAFYFVDQYAIWGILTVIVMFEFSIGATLIKGFNRGLGTIAAGILAFSFAQLSQLAGKFDEAVIVISIFLVAFVASYLKLYPTMRPYEYGFRVFVLTYCILMVAGLRNGLYTEAVLSRLVLIALGAVVCLLVNICIFPIWSGEDLHRLLVKNFNGVASSLEGCVNGYLQCVEYERIPSKILTFQASEDTLYKGYRSVVESTSQEEALVTFAVWEPPHGRYKLYKYPWENYAKLGGSLRHCAFTVMALHGCILAEIQASAEKRQVFSSELQRVGVEGAKLLRLLASKVENMEKLERHKDVLRDVHEAAELLQKKIDKKSYLLVNSDSWEIRQFSPSRPRNDTTLDHQQDHNDETNNDSTKEYRLGFKSFSETLLNGYAAAKAESWPFKITALSGEAESKIYESASSLSLATFASLLIECVARLQNVVETFEELSEKAEFGDPDAVQLDVLSHRGKLKEFSFWSRLLCCFSLKRR